MAHHACHAALLVLASQVWIAAAQSNAAVAKANTVDTSAWYVPWPGERRLTDLFQEEPLSSSDSSSESSSWSPPVIQVHGEEASHGSGSGSSSSSSSGGSEHSHHPNPGLELRSLTAWLVLFAVGFPAFLVYTIRNDERVCWHILDLVTDLLAIFIAVLVFVMVHRLAVRGCGGAERRADLILFMLFGLILEIVMHTFRKEHRHLEAFANVSGHAFGFSGIQFFDVLMRTLGSSSVLAAAAVAAGAGFIFAVFTFVARRVRICIRAHYGEQEAFWEEACSEVEEEATMLCMSLLASAILRFAVTGELPPLNGYPGNKTAEHIHALGLICLGLAALVIILTVMLRKYHNRGAALAKGFLSYTMAWSTVFWAQWHVYFLWHVDKMVMKCFLAFGNTVIALIVIVLVHYLSLALGEKSVLLRQLIRAGGLLAGIGWEKAFLAAVKVLFPGYGMDDLLKTLASSALLVIIVVPVYYMFFRVQHHIKHHLLSAETPGGEIAAAVAICDAKSADEESSSCESFGEESDAF